MTAAPYGDKGCRCWRSEDYNPWDDRTHHEWMPNASCPQHGLLAGLARDRMETGTYRVDLSTPPDGPECPPGVHSMFDPCPGGCLNDDDEIDEKEAAEEEAEAEYLNGLLCRRHGVDDCFCSGPPDYTIALAAEYAPNPRPEGECPPPRPGSLEWFAEERARRDAERGPGPADCAWGEPFACRVHCRPGQNGKGSILEPHELVEVFAPGSRECPVQCRANPMDCPGPAADGSCLGPTTEKEQRVVLAAVRRWWRRYFHRSQLDDRGYCTRCD